MEIPSPPTQAACSPCGSPLVWLWSPRRGGWVSFVPHRCGGDPHALTPHRCKHSQDLATWRHLRRVPDETFRRGVALARKAIERSQ